MQKNISSTEEEFFLQGMNVEKDFALLDRTDYFSCTISKNV